MGEFILSIHEALGSISRILKTARERERERGFTICPPPFDAANCTMCFIKPHRAGHV